MTTSEDEEFDRSARMPLIWQITARQLIAAANRLRNGHEAAKQEMSFYASRMPILLLFGLAAENLVKGVLVAQGTVPVVSDVKKGSLKLSDEIKSHNLETLCRKAGLAINSTDQEVLNNLAWTVSSGKYPVGTKPPIDPDDPAPLWLELTNLDHVCQILNRLEAALRSTGQSWVLEEVDLCSFGLPDEGRATPPSQ